MGTRKCFWLLLLIFGCEDRPEDKTQDFPISFETSKGSETATYEEAIDFYKALAREFPEINIQTIGSTDSDIPLNVVTFNTEADFNFQKLAEDKTVVLINNAIHPGESDGVDASMMLFRDLALEKIRAPENVVVVTIPVYNIGGALNRGSKTRVNQHGPTEYGFRGNARNYDLNRDFIKGDTKNTRTFYQIYHLVQPDVFVDTHVSNGADYQYALSHLFTQHNKLGGESGAFIEERFIPDIEKMMSDGGWPATPYVNVFNRPPDKGFIQFIDHPRYSTGYTSLWNTFGLMIETHMLKPYEERVNATYEFLNNLVSFCEAEHQKIKALRKTAKEVDLKRIYYPIKWQIDSTKNRTLAFKGYQADTLISSVTGFSRLSYDRDQPFTKNIPYYNEYLPVDSVRIPSAYILGKQWQGIIELLDLNGISYTRIAKDTVINVESYRISNYKSYENPYEGHYPHYSTRVEGKFTDQYFAEGDYWIPTDQSGIRYLMETLEPAAMDSFFNWNFFDTVLQQKEGFSPYVFEDLAEAMLDSDSVMQQEFLQKKESDEVFAQNWYAQLQWIYAQSEYYESTFMQYPVYRVHKGLNQDR
ncbi:MAG: M14 family metallopeptidase [Flavobacteriaceae bacterium]